MSRNFGGAFTVLFTVLGALSGVLGSFLVTYRTALNVIAGIIVILFGLHFIGSKGELW